MIVNVNNKAVETSASTLSQLVEELHLPENGVAVGVDTVWCHAPRGMSINFQKE